MTTNSQTGNSLTIKICADRYEAIVIDGGKKTVIDLASMPKYKRVKLVGQLYEWKSDGFRGNPPNIQLHN